MHKRSKIIYWILTLLMFIPGFAGAAVELFTNGPESIVKIMIALGYPVYLMKILGFAKLLGSVAILGGKFPKLPSPHLRRKRSGNDRDCFGSCLQVFNEYIIFCSLVIDRKNRINK